MNDEKNIEKMIELMRRDNSVDAPGDSIKWAKNLFLGRERKPSLVKRMAAVLQMDLSPQKTVVGERSGAAQARQMLFAAGENAVDLRVVESKKKVTIKGQVLGEGFENAKVTLQGVSLRFEADGEPVFELKNVPKGAYTLTVQGDSAEITVEHLDL